MPMSSRSLDDAHTLQSALSCHCLQKVWAIRAYKHLDAHSHGPTYKCSIYALLHVVYAKHPFRFSFVPFHMFVFLSPIFEVDNQSLSPVLKPPFFYTVPQALCNSSIPTQWCQSLAERRSNKSFWMRHKPRVMRNCL